MASARRSLLQWMVRAAPASPPPPARLPVETLSRVARGIGVAHILLAFAFCPRIAHAQATTPLVVTVGSADTHAFLKDAEIILVDLKRFARTDALGEARILGVPNGVHRLRVRLLGYAASEIDLRFDGDTVGPVFLLERLATALNAVTIVSTWATPHFVDFERRRRMGLGRFLTDSQLTKIENQDLNIVIQTHFPGVRVEGDLLISSRGSCGAGSSLGGDGAGRRLRGRGGGSSIRGSCFGGPCVVRVYVDGVYYVYGTSVLPTWAIAGVEYYTGASVPVEYRVSGSGCGVLLLWSKV